LKIGLGVKPGDLKFIRVVISGDVLRIESPGIFLVLGIINKNRLLVEQSIWPR
jgi:hypothetical protein